MLSVVCWKWRSPKSYRSTFGAEQVHILRNMVERHYQFEHRFICVTDDPTGIDNDRVETVPLWNDFSNVPNPAGVGNPSCYRRLRMFSKGIVDTFGERFISLDLDCVITDDVSPLWNRPEPFVIWGDTNPRTPYNGSMILLSVGAREQVWTQFDPKTSPKAAKKLGYFGSDQAWIGACLGPHEPKWSKDDGVLSFRNHIYGRNHGALPGGARIVFFHGRFDPWQPQVIRQYEFVREHYR